MDKETQRKQLEKMLRKCPEILTPLKAARWMPIGKNRLYAEIKNGNIEAYVYKGGYILAKDAVIDYLIRTTPDTGKRFTIGGGHGNQ